MSVLGAFSLIGIVGCHELVQPAALPAGQADPGAYDTPAGAQQQALGALALFHKALRTAALFPMTDELTGAVGITGGSRHTSSDQRIDQLGDQSIATGVGSALSNSLNNARLQANLAQKALAKFASATPSKLRAEVLAAQGYTEVFLADEYCSGIPLSTIDFEATFTYDSPRTTQQVYQHAAALFAEAVPLATGGDSITTFARVGWGRALLAQGLFDSAAHVVAPVLTPSVYSIRRRAAGALGGSATVADYGGGSSFSWFSIGDREGIHGLQYFSSFDPRIPTQSTSVASTDAFGHTLGQVRLYWLTSEFNTDSTAIRIASGIEARLIEAEAALQHALTTHASSDLSTWLTDLNTLRTTGDNDGTFPVYQKDSVGFDFNTFTVVYDSTLVRVDTLWRAGSGNVARLGVLHDPGALLSGVSADSARIDLMFKERAFWLFLQGQRQGDMRRLIRQYHRTENQVYPSGGYPLGGSYGHQVNFPTIDDGNPLFHGCINRDA